MELILPVAAGVILGVLGMVALFYLWGGILTARDEAFIGRYEEEQRANELKERGYVYSDGEWKHPDDVRSAE